MISNVHLFASLFNYLSYMFQHAMIYCWEKMMRSVNI